MGFKDFLGGPSKCFTQANKKQQRETVHAVYSVSKNRSECNSIGELRSEPTILEKISLQRELSVSENCSDLNTIGEFRSKPTNLVKISHQGELHVSKNCSELNTNGELRSEPTNLVKISHHSQRSVSITTDLISSASPAKLARVTYLSTSDKREQTGSGQTTSKPF